MHRQFGMMTAVAVIFMSCFLLTCGDVEANPGPNVQDKTLDTYDIGSNNMAAATGANLQQPTTTEGHAVLDLKESLIRSMNQCMKDSIQEVRNQFQDQQHQQMEMLRLQQDKQTERLEHSMKEMMGPLQDQMKRVEVNQQEMQGEVRNLRLQCTELQKENCHLKEELILIKSKCDSLENFSRRNNLLFFGLGRKQGEKETWEGCEQKVMNVITEGMGLGVDIEIERAHRTGKGDAIVVCFLSYKDKDLILKKSYKLKDSDKFRNVFVREDFSFEIRRKRQGLKAKAKMLYDMGQKARIKYDKLICSEGVFTFDTGKGEVVRIRDARHEVNSEIDKIARARKDVDSCEGNENDPFEIEGEDTRGQASDLDWNYNPVGFSQENFPPVQTQNSGCNADFSQVTERLKTNVTKVLCNDVTERSRNLPPDNAMISSQESRRSPVITRHRGMHSQSSNRPVEKAGKQINTLHSWVNSGSKQAKRGVDGGRARPTVPNNEEVDWN